MADNEKRDYVAETVQAFIKDAQGIDPTDPVKAIEAYFQKNATDELKAKCKAEGKDAAPCWKFIEAVARKALGNRSGHIDPAVVYAIAMHYFQDVPVDWDGCRETASEPAAKRHTPRASAKVEKAKKAKRPEIPKSAQPKPETPKPETPKPETLPPGTKPKKAKPRFEQGFLFEMLETQPESEVQG